MIFIFIFPIEPKEKLNIIPTEAEGSNIVGTVAIACMTVAFLMILTMDLRIIYAQLLNMRYNLFQF